MANAVSLPGERLAGMQIDLLQKLRQDVRTLDELNLFLQGKNPFEKTLVTAAAAAIINPRETLFTRDGLWIDPDLEKFVGLDPCPVDERPLRLIHRVKSGKQFDSEIATSLGGMDLLAARKATLGQLVYQIQLALDGKDNYFKSNTFYVYILYLEGKDGYLYPVIVRCTGTVTRSGNTDIVREEWRVHCHQFDQSGGYDENFLTFGN